MSVKASVHSFEAVFIVSPLVSTQIYAQTQRQGEREKASDPISLSESTIAVLLIDYNSKYCTVSECRELQ